MKNDLFIPSSIHHMMKSIFIFYTLVIWASPDYSISFTYHNIHDPFSLLLKEMLRDDPCTGTGKPEPLKHNLSGLWSRRISQKDRVIYKYDKEYIYIYAIGGHYSQF